MKRRVAVVGGAGAFGRKLVEGLRATTDCEVLVCGRATIDRNTAGAAEVKALGAFCVVDAAGPFQGQNLRFARAVIEAGCHYVDLADARDFVEAFPSLDALAKAHGVLAVTGASSTPALSQAVLDELTRGWARVDSVEIAISPGNRAPFGLSVIKAILSYVGRPVRVLLNGRWTTTPGWGLLTRKEFGDLGVRMLSLCETPDLDLVPRRFPRVRNAIFRAGLELSVFHLAVLALSLPVRAGWIKSLVPLAEPLRDAAAFFRRLGSDCGGMRVEVSGIYGDGKPLQSTWTLIAEAGDGPQIPALPALCVVQALAEGRLAQRGAMACVGLVDLETIEQQFKRFRIHIARETRVLERAPLFARVMNEFAKMPSAVRAAHVPDPACEFEGEVDIDGAGNLAARAVAWLFGFPPEGRAQPASVTIEREGDGEVWIRRFGKAVFASHLSAGGTANQLIERFGLLNFDLQARADVVGFELSIVGGTLFGLALPRVVLPSTRAKTAVDEHGRYRFDVLITLPGVGRLVRYRGWLAPVTSAPSP
jgi:saccharopine dehydrogenase-like NADP-dependent oxidoreductase